MSEAKSSGCRALAAMCEAVPSLEIVGDRTTPIAAIACNTELADVVPGSLFAPLDLSPAQTAEVAARAVERGAVALLVDQQMALPATQVVVPNVRAALAQIAATFYDHPARELGCIGVTGTDGKTTTTFLIDAILRHAGRRPGLIGSLEWRVGDEWTDHQTGQTTPESPDMQRLLRRMVDAGDQWAILEATSHGLALHRLDEIPYAVAAVTFIGMDHLDFHRTIEAYRRAKGILFERAAASGGVAVINADDPPAREMRAFVGEAKRLTYSASGQKADFRASSIRASATGLEFTIKSAEGKTPVSLRLFGEYNVANALCAAAVAHATGVSLAEIGAGLSAAPPVPGLLASIDAGQPFRVLVDEAKSAVQLVLALDVARQLAGDGRVIAVVGGADKSGALLMRQKGEISTLAADFAVFTTQLALHSEPDEIVAQVAAGALAAGGVEGKTFVRVVDRREAIRHAFEIARPGDCVVLTGKGTEDALTVGDTVHRWDEAGIARQLLAELGYRVDEGAEKP